MSTYQIGILNITSYAGVELVRLINNHPYVKLSWGTGRGTAGLKLNHVFPHLIDMDLPVLAEPPSEADMVFSALPHKASAESLLPFLQNNIKVVDISADFRLKDASQYPQWYDFHHPTPEWLNKATYGLPELHRQDVAASQLVANPGCYPTSAILSLAPAVKEGIIEGDIIIDSKSGVSGAGRTLSMNTHYSEANENLSAYNSYIRFNLVNWRRLQPPTQVYPATRALDPKPIGTFTAVGATRHADLSYTVGFPFWDDWGLLIFRDTGGPSLAPFNKMIHVMRLSTAAAETWTDTPVAAGAHTYHVVPFSTDGKIDWTNYDNKVATVT